MGEFRSSNFLGSIGVGYRIRDLNLRASYESYFSKYEMDSLFGESNNRSDFSFTVGYRI